MHFKLKRSDGATWCLIFLHNFPNGNYFKSKEEAKYSLNPNRYSILKLIPKLSRYDKKYEFLLEYPGYDALWWTQDVSPISQVETSTDGSEIGLDIKRKTNFTKFRGLLLSSDSSSYIDGSSISLSNYRYSIGTITFSQKIPGPCVENIGVVDVDLVKLWMRVKDMMLTLNCQRSKSTIIILLFIFFNVS